MCVVIINHSFLKSSSAIRMFVVRSFIETTGKMESVAVIVEIMQWFFYSFRMYNCKKLSKTLSPLQSHSLYMFKNAFINLYVLDKSDRKILRLIFILFYITTNSRCIYYQYQCYRIHKLATFSLKLMQDWKHIYMETQATPKYYVTRQKNIFSGSYFIFVWCICLPSCHIYVCVSFSNFKVGRWKKEYTFWSHTHRTFDTACYFILNIDGM